MRHTQSNHDQIGKHKVREEKPPSVDSELQASELRDTKKDNFQRSAVSNVNLKQSGATQLSPSLQYSESEQLHASNPPRKANLDNGNSDSARHEDRLL